MSDFPEFIRVRVKDSGTEQTIAKPSAIDPAVYEVLDEDAVDHNGRPLAPKFPDAPTYDDMTVPDLKDEIARRNEGRDEAHQIPAAGNKPDLVAALVADDNQKES
jgi:hypothetical protein